MTHIIIRILFTSIIFQLVSQQLYADSQLKDLEYKVPSGNKISITRLNVTGSKAVFWLPSEHGQTNNDKKFAYALANQGYEVWLVDLYNSYFFAPVPSSLYLVPVTDLSHLLNQFMAADKKQKIVLTSGRTAAILLEALKSSTSPSGVILISPNLYVETPEPGSEVTYLPVTSQTKQVLEIIQPKLSPWYWYLDKQTRLLESGGSRVSVTILPAVRDRFYFRPDTMASEKKLQDTFVRLLVTTINKFGENRQGKSK